MGCSGLAVQLLQAKNNALVRLFNDRSCSLWTVSMRWHWRRRCQRRQARLAHIRTNGERTAIGWSRGRRASMRPKSLNDLDAGKGVPVAPFLALISVSVGTMLTAALHASLSAKRGALAPVSPQKR